MASTDLQSQILLGQLGQQGQGRRQSAMAERLLAQATSGAPVFSPGAAIAKALTGGLAGWMAGRAGEQERADMESAVTRAGEFDQQRREGWARQLAEAEGQPNPGEYGPPGPRSPEQRMNMLATLAGQGNPMASAQLPVAQFQANQQTRAAEREEERQFRNRQLALQEEAARRAGARQPSDIERRIALMVQNGVPQNIAVGLATGQLETRQDPQDGTITVFDRSNGRVLFGPNAGGVIGQPQTAPGAAPAAGAAPPAAGGAPAAPAAPGATSGTLPEGADFRGATGLPGFGAEAANYVADLFGGRSLPAPERAAASQALRNLDTRTRMFLQSAIPGRPSNYLMEMIGGLTVSPATIGLGPERARERVGQTTRFLDQTVREMQEIAGAQGTGRFTKQDIGEANRVLVSLRPLLADYRQLERAFAPPEPDPRRPQSLLDGAEPPPSAQQPVRVRTPEEARSLPSGTPIVLPDGTIGRVR